MKKLLSFVFVAILALILFGCDKTKPTFEISVDLATIKVGDEIIIDYDTNVKDPEIDWSTSDETIASINENGVLTALKAGSVEVIAVLKGFGEKKLTITIEEKDLTAAELKKLLTGVLGEYSKAKGGSAKITAENEEGLMTSELVFNLAENGDVSSLMYKLVDKDEMHVFVKDGVAYLLANGAKTKSTLTAQEKIKLKDDYSFAKFAETIAKFYNEDAFYNAIEIVKNENGVVEVKLQLAKYNGNVFVTEGKDEVKVLVSINNEKVTKVEVQTKEGTKTSKAIIEYLGTGNQNITYPTDLDSYK